MTTAPGRGAPLRATLFVAREALGFAAAHFSIVDGRSETLHGHNYRMTVEVEGEVGPAGTLVDFGALKTAARAECDRLDHRMLVPTLCAEVDVVEGEAEVELREGSRRFLLPRGDVALLPIRNTTCECLAGHLLARLRDRLGDLPVRLRVGLEESPGQGATVVEEEP